MSEEKEEFDVLDIPDAAEESDDFDETIKIPVISEELPESDQTEDHESEQELLDIGLEPHAKESSLSLPSNEEEQLSPDEGVASEQVSDRNVTELDTPKQYSNDYYQALMDKIKAVKSSMKTAVIDSTATGITQGRWDHSYPHLKKACFFLFVFA